MSKQCRVRKCPEEWSDDFESDVILDHYRNEHGLEPMSECSGCGEEFLSLRIKGTDVYRDAYCDTCTDEDPMLVLVLEESGADTCAQCGGKGFIVVED